MRPDNWNYCGGCQKQQGTGKRHLGNADDITV